MLARDHDLTGAWCLPLSSLYLLTSTLVLGHVSKEGGLSYQIAIIYSPIGLYVCVLSMSSRR